MQVLAAKSAFSHSFPSTTLAETARVASATKTTVAAVSGRDVLVGLARALDELDFSGRGDAAYWMRAVDVHVDSAHALGGALARLALFTQGSVRGTLQGLANQLNSLDSSGRGDSSYWVARDSAVGRVVNGVRDQLFDVAKVLDASTALPLSSVLLALGGAARALPSGGRGDIDYWMRTASDRANFAQGIGAALFEAAKSAQGAEQGLVQSIARRFTAISAAGRGDVDYWMARATGILDETRSLGDTLLRMAGA